MCILIYNFFKREDSQLILSFNRDELYSRSWEKPKYHWGNGLFGCKDISSSGSWLVINNYGLIACIINLEVKAIKKKSRGSIPLMINDCKSIKSALTKLKKQILPYNYLGFNLYLFDQNQLVQISNVRNNAITSSICVEKIDSPFGIITKHGINSNEIKRGSNVFPSWINDCKISIHKILLTIKQKLIDKKNGMILKDIEWGTTSSILINYKDSKTIMWNYSNKLMNFQYDEIPING
ncbi:hypothetical protein EZY14_017165 [Kordia sp. TARA_039_SRF]|nr:hypothetical protein EZY14_017165 [Kordia sp. TARA_039_SRF]